MKRITGFALCLSLVLSISLPAAAWSPRLSVDDDTWIQLGFLGQFRFESKESSGGEYSKDFYTRRARIMGLGSVHENVKFFFSTDVPNTGLSSGTPNTMVWNDGFVDFQLMPELKIAFGRILVPFSPENQASAAALLGIDYNLNLLKLPTYVDRSFWRDDGIELRGMLIDGFIDYRLGVFRGNRDMAQNSEYLPRATGMVMINLADSQPGWFYNPNSLGSLNIVSLGGGADYIMASDADDSLAWNVFLKVEQPVGGGSFNAMLAYYDWDGPAWNGFQGNTYGAQLGYLLPGELLGGRLQPVLRFQRQEADSESGMFLNTINAGLNYYIKGQAANLKFDYAINDSRAGGPGGDRTDAFRFQAQLLF